MPAQPVTDPSAAPRLILASASARRAGLLREYGYQFEVIAPPLGEPTDLGRATSPAQHAEALSYFKAKSAAGQLTSRIVLSADTVAAIGNAVIGKPADREDARQILQRLSGTTHCVITGVTLLNVSTAARIVTHDSTDVSMKPLSDAEIDEYLDTGAWEGKAGAYGIQDHGDAFVTRLQGSFTNVVGLPMELVAGLLDGWNITPSRTR